MTTEKPTVLQGTLEAYYELGADSVSWSFNEALEKKTEPYDGLHELQKGDFIRVFNDASKKEVIFEGKIDMTYRKNGKPYPLNHGYYQKGQDPAAWEKMFQDGKPAELIVRPSHVKKLKA